MLLGPQPVLQQLRHLLGHHPLHPHPRPREPHEEQAAGLVVPLREVALREHDGVGGLALEAVDGVGEQLALALLVGLLLLAPPARAAEMTGRVVGIVDGDPIDVLTPRLGTVRVRLAEN